MSTSFVLLTHHDVARALFDQSGLERESKLKRYKNTVQQILQNTFTWLFFFSLSFQMKPPHLLISSADQTVQPGLTVKRKMGRRGSNGYSGLTSLGVLARSQETGISFGSVRN